MRTIMIMVALVGATAIAHAQAGTSLASPTTGTLGTTSTTPAPSGGFALGHATGNTNMNVPPPPPASVTTPANEQGVPPTPAPARPGLPTPPTTGGTPTTIGLDAQALTVTRPGQAFGPDTIARVQTVLSQNGYYRGPIDGEISGTTRAAIRAFQSSAGLPATGQLDAQTASLLGALSNGVATTSSPVPPPAPSAATGGGNAAVAGTVNTTGLPAPTGTTGIATGTTGSTATTGTPVPTVGATVPGVASGTGVVSYGAPGTVTPLAVTPKQQPSTSQTPPNATVTAPSGRTIDTRPFPLSDQVQSAPSQQMPIFVEP